MSLDPNKLKGLRDKGDKKIAQCPACAAEGGDSKREHLVIYPDGNYGCVVHPKDKSHQKEILRLVGASNPEAASGPTPVRVRRPACLTRGPKVILVLNSLAAPVERTGPVTTELVPLPAPTAQVAKTVTEAAPRPVALPAPRPVPLPAPKPVASPAPRPEIEGEAPNSTQKIAVPAPNSGVTASAPAVIKRRHVSIAPNCLMLSVPEGPDMQQRIEAARREWEKRRHSFEASEPNVCN